MPIFEVQSGGKTFEVEAPDMQTAVKALGRRRLLIDEEIMGGRPDFRAMFAPTEPKPGSNPFADLIPSKKRLLSDEEILATPPVDDQRNPWDELIRQHQTPAAGEKPDYRSLFAPGGDVGGLQSPKTAESPARGEGPHRIYGGLHAFPARPGRCPGLWR